MTRKVEEGDKKAITEMLTQGRSSQEVADLYPDYTVMQIAALKAWITMRNQGGRDTDGKPKGGAKGREPKKTGTRQWADKNINIMTGCSHDCRYCFARDQLVRTHYTGTADWPVPVLRQDDVLHAKSMRGNCTGGIRIMHPSSHDILPQFIDVELDVIRSMLANGNRLLLVTKPHLMCVQKICDGVRDYRDRVLWRMTVGSTSDKVLSLWEPGAPEFGERLASLRYARDAGYSTSVSIEPILDPSINMVERTVSLVSPYVTDSIWIGTGKKMRQRIAVNGFKDDKEIQEAVSALVDYWSEETVLELVKRFQNECRIKWKDQIEAILLKIRLGKAA
jgi:hypothetical protein